MSSTKPQLDLSNAEDADFTTEHNGNGHALVTAGGKGILDLVESVIAKYGSEQAESASNVISAMYEIHKTERARDEERQFAEALFQFQEKCPPIRKSQTGTMTKRDGTKAYTYDYPDLEQIERIVRPILKKVGILYTFDTQVEAVQGARDYLMTVYCKLRHRGGHVEVAHFSCTTESPSGASPQQKAGGAETYAKRRALLSCLGLDQCAKDTDGLPDDYGEAPKSNTIDQGQIKRLDDLLADIEKHEDGFRGKWMAYRKIADVSEIAPADFSGALNELEKRKATHDQN